MISNDILFNLLLKEFFEFFDHQGKSHVVKSVIDLSEGNYF